MPIALLDLPPEILNAIVGPLETTDCLWFSSSCKAFQPWRSRGWAIIEVQNQTLTQVIRALARLAAVLVSNSTLSTYIHEIYVREPAGTESTHTPRLDQNLAAVLRECMKLSTFVFNAPQEHTGYYSLTWEAICALNHLELLSLGHFIGPGRSRTSPKTRNPSRLKHVNLVLTRAVDINIMLTDQPHLETLHVELYMYPEPDVTLGTSWTHLHTLSIAAGESGDGVSDPWEFWLSTIKVALVRGVTEVHRDMLIHLSVARR